MNELLSQQILIERGLALASTVFELLVIAIVAALACSFTRRVAGRTVASAISRAQTRAEDSAPELAKRYQTLGGVVTRAIEVVIWTVAGFTALSQLGIDIAPVLASAGVVGIAVGFGAQSLVRDFLAGLFILFENQYGRGDVVQIAGIGGVVEDMNLRRTVLRDLDGTVHHIPNGEVRVASNLTRDWSRVNISIPVGYDEDLDRVTAVINRVGKELAADPDFGPLIVEPPKALRVDSFSESGVMIKVLGTTRPAKQWEITGEYRRRLKRAFDEEGIELAVPHRTLLLGHGWPQQGNTDLFPRA